LEISESVTQACLLSEKDAADYLAIAYRTLWGWRKQGRISHIRFGSSVRYKKEDLDEFIRTHRVQA
jgi:excisionase family DNA binding protein